MWTFSITTTQRRRGESSKSTLQEKQYANCDLQCNQEPIKLRKRGKINKITTGTYQLWIRTFKTKWRNRNKSTIWFNHPPADVTWRNFKQHFTDIYTNLINNSKSS